MTTMINKGNEVCCVKSLGLVLFALQFSLDGHFTWQLQYIVVRINNNHHKINSYCGSDHLFFPLSNGFQDNPSFGDLHCTKMLYQVTKLT